MQQKQGGQKRPNSSPAPQLIPTAHLASVGGQQLANHVTSNHLPVGATVAGNAPPNTGTSGRGPFASALRNLAKQADIKEEECDTRGSGGTAGNGAQQQQQQHQQQQQPPQQQQQQSRSSNVDARNDGRTSDGRTAAEDRANNSKKRPLSPQPPEKVRVFPFYLLVSLIICN